MSVHRRPRKKRRVRLDDAIATFFDSWPYEGPRVPSPETVRTYREHLTWLANFAHARERFYVADLGPEFLRHIFREILTATSSPAPNFKGGQSKANGVTFAVRALFRWLIVQGVEVPDISRVRPPKAPERVQVRLQPGEFQALEHAVLRRLVDPAYRPWLLRPLMARDIALLWLLYDTGLRANEVCSMIVSDVDTVTGHVTVRHAKGGKQRMINIRDADDPSGGNTPRRLAEWIAARSLIPHAAEHEMLWVTQRGKPLSPDMLRWALSRICVAAGLDGNRPPHAFRRSSFSEHYNEAPQSLPVLVERMGWSVNSRKMVDTYVRGAQISVAATQELPSLAARWHSGARTQPVRRTAWETVASTSQTAVTSPSRRKEARSK